MGNLLGRERSAQEVDDSFEAQVKREDIANQPPVNQAVHRTDTSHQPEGSHNNEPTYIQEVTGSIARFFVGMSNQESSEPERQPIHAYRVVRERVNRRRNCERTDHAALVRHILRNPNDWKARRKANWVLRRTTHREIERYTAELRRESHIYASLMARPRLQSIHDYVRHYCYRRN